MILFNFTFNFHIGTTPACAGDGGCGDAGGEGGTARWLSKRGECPPSGGGAGGWGASGEASLGLVDISKWDFEAGPDAGDCGASSIRTRMNNN